MASVIHQHDTTAAHAPRRERSGELHGDAEFHNALAWLLPDPIRKHGGRIENLQEPLHDAEAAFVRDAVERRVMEFTAGRACAHTALRALGVQDAPIRMGDRCQPLWPVGAVGSISHAAGYCIAAVAPRERVAGLGVDIESADPLPESLINLVCTSSEKAEFERRPALPGALLAKFIFSAKEAVFKCLYPVFGEELDFEDVDLEPDVQGGRFIAHVSRVALNANADLELHGRLACTSRLVMSAVSLYEIHREWRSAGRLLRALNGCEGRYICN